MNRFGMQLELIEHKTLTPDILGADLGKLQNNSRPRSNFWAAQNNPADVAAVNNVSQAAPQLDTTSSAKFEIYTRYTPLAVQKGGLRTQGTQPVLLGFLPPESRLTDLVAATTTNENPQ